MEDQDANNEEEIFLQRSTVFTPISQKTASKKHNFDRRCLAKKGFKYRALLKCIGAKMYRKWRVETEEICI